MLIVGAGGHAKELLGIFAENNITEEIYLFDDYSNGGESKLFNKFTILKTELEVKQLFATDNRFVIGVGSPLIRQQLERKMETLGGDVDSIISSKASIGQFNVALGKGLNILTGAVITQNVIIGHGSLIHINATIHHDCVIGNYCEISPSCNILGNVKMGDFCSIGAGAVILPNVQLGNKVTIGAGAVVTRNVQDNQTLKGVPAK